MPTSVHDDTEFVRHSICHIEPVYVIMQVGHVGLHLLSTQLAMKTYYYGRQSLLATRDVKALRPMWPRGQIIPPRPRPQPRPHSFWPRLHAQLASLTSLVSTITAACNGNLLLRSSINTARGRRIAEVSLMLVSICCRDRRVKLSTTNRRCP